MRATALATSFALALLGGHAAAEQPLGCLATREARAAVRSGHALDFARVKAEVERATGSEVLRAQLCRQDGRLVYALTVLRFDGQVMAMVVDALDGAQGAAEARPSWLDRRQSAARPGG
jgi:hypothetical protein